MTRSRAFACLSPAALLAALACAPTAAAHPCDLLYNAGIKAMQTPHHVYSTTTPAAGGNPMAGEAILAGGVEYVLLGGQWRRSPMAPAEMIQNTQEKLKTHPDTCTPLGDQSVDGQSVTAYTVHNDESGTDSQVTVLKSSGLMHGSTITLPNGSRVQSRYEYANVQPPAGVK